MTKDTKTKASLPESEGWLIGPMGDDAQAALAEPRKRDRLRAARGGHRIDHHRIILVGHMVAWDGSSVNLGERCGQGNRI